MLIGSVLSPRPSLAASWRGLRVYLRVLRASGDDLALLLLSSPARARPQTRAHTAVRTLYGYIMGYMYIQLHPPDSLRRGERRRRLGVSRLHVVWSLWWVHPRGRRLRFETTRQSASKRHERAHTQHTTDTNVIPTHECPPNTTRTHTHTVCE